MEEFQMMKEREKYDQNQPLIKSFEESQQNLARQGEEYERKLKSSQVAKQSLEKARQEAMEKAELLSKQLEIFRQHGLSPQERAFLRSLGEAKQLLKHHQVQTPRCFISYAWENMATPDGKALNKEMQEWIGRLSKDLKKLGCKVFFDLSDMSGNLRKTMLNNISQSNCFIIICTPQWKKRIEAGLTPSLQDYIENNRLAELETALQTLSTNQPDKNFQPSNNTTFEFIHIWAKVKRAMSSNTLIPIIFSGTSSEASLAVMRGDLIPKVTELGDEGALGKVSDLLGVKPGLIPDVFQLISDIFGLKNDGHEQCWKEYTLLEAKLRDEMSKIQLEMERAELQVKIDNKLL